MWLRSSHLRRATGGSTIVMMLSQVTWQQHRGLSVMWHTFGHSLSPVWLAEDSEFLRYCAWGRRRCILLLGPRDTLPCVEPPLATLRTLPQRRCRSKESRQYRATHGSKQTYMASSFVAKQLDKAPRWHSQRDSSAWFSTVDRVPTVIDSI